MAGPSTGSIIESDESRKAQSLKRAVDFELWRLYEVREREGDETYADAVGGTLVTNLILSSSPDPFLQESAIAIVNALDEKIEQIQKAPELSAHFISGIRSELQRYNAFSAPKKDNEQFGSNVP
jgi:hypothetical protein